MCTPPAAIKSSAASSAGIGVNSLPLRCWPPEARASVRLSSPCGALCRKGTLSESPSEVSSRRGAADCLGLCEAVGHPTGPLAHSHSPWQPRYSHQAGRAVRPTPTHPRGHAPTARRPAPSFGACLCREPAPLVGGDVQARLPPARPCRSAAWVSRRALTPVIPSRCSHTAAPHLLPRPPPAHARATPCLPAFPPLLGPDPRRRGHLSCRDGWGRQASLFAWSPSRGATLPPYGALPGQVAAGVFWGARLCHWWIFLNPAGGGGERSALPAAAPGAPALPPLLSAATARLAPGGPARSPDAEMKVLGHRLQLLTGTAARCSPLPLSDLEQARGAVARVGRGDPGCAFPGERNLEHTGLY